MRSHNWTMIRVTSQTAQRLRGVATYKLVEAHKAGRRPARGRRKLYSYDLVIKHLLDYWSDLSGTVSR